MSEQTLRQHLENAIEYQRICMAGGEEPGLYHAILVHPGNTISMYALDASMFGPWEMNNKIMAVLVKDLFDMGGVCLSLVIEGFAGRCPSQVDPGTLPDDLSQWPEIYRQTVLLCSANAPGEKGVCCLQVFKREAGQVTYEPIVWWGENNGSMRFCYDFRGVTCWQDAVQLVMLRNQEGEVSTQ